MAKVECTITRNTEKIYVGDLVTYKGTHGLLCEKNSRYYIQGFGGYVLKDYADDYSAIDTDIDVILICSKEDLVINLSKKGE